MTKKSRLAGGGNEIKEKEKKIIRNRTKTERSAGIMHKELYNKIGEMRISFRYLEGENKTRRTQSCIQYLLYPPQTKFGGYIGITPSVCLSVCPSVRLSRVNLTLVIPFQPIQIRLSYYTCWFLVARPFCPYQKI